MRRPFAEVTPSRAGMLQAKAASRKQPRRGVCSFDAAWHQGHALGHVQQVAGCGCVAPGQTPAVDQPSLLRSHRRPVRGDDSVWGVLRRGLEVLLAHCANLLQEPSTFVAMLARMRSEVQDCTDTPPDLGLVEPLGQGGRLGAVGGTAKSASCARERQAVMDIIWGMAVMRPRIKLAQMVMRTLPRWRSFQRHRRMAKRLMPHWFPLRR